MKAKNEEAAVYLVTPVQSSEDSVIAQALDILSKRLKRGDVMANPIDARNYLRLKLGSLEHETFTVMFLDNNHSVIAIDEMFRGTLTQTSVYPREVVKAALAHNAAAVILAHNHPSGLTEPSRADEFLTQTLKVALNLVDVRVLDHVIVGLGGSTSLAEKGLL